MQEPPVETAVPVVTIAPDVQIRVDNNMEPGTVEFAQLEPVGFFKLPPGITFGALLESAVEAREQANEWMREAATQQAVNYLLWKQAEQAFAEGRPSVTYSTSQMLKLLAPRAEA